MASSRIASRALRRLALASAGLAGALGAVWTLHLPSGAILPILVAAGAGALAAGWRDGGSPRARLEGARARRAHARHLELLSEHANDVVLMVDHRGRIVVANDRVSECHGWSAAELVGLDVRALRAPGHGDDFDAHIARIRREGHLRYETVHRRRDGTTFPVEVSARGFEADGAWFFQAIVRDITERKEALRAVSYQAELLRNLHEAVIGLDAQQVIRSWNTAAERIYGYAADEVIGRHIREVLPSEYRGYASYEEFVQALDRDGRMNFDVRRRQRNGSWVDVEAAAVALRGEDGRITGYVSLNRDVTARKRAEAALRANQERLARILETSNDGLWIVDVLGRTEFVNDRAAGLLGATPDDLIGRSFLELVPDAESAEAEADLESIASGASIQREISMRRPDGSELWLHLSRKALRDPDGRVVGAVAVFMDVTEQRRAREQLLHAQKLEAIGRLASGVAHDFNNLLVSILSCSGFLLEGLGEGDPLREEAFEIKKAGERAARLVRQLLTFGRKSPFRPVAVNVNTVVRQIETILRRAAGEDVALTVSLDASWPIRIDPGRLEQVLMNLTVNARDAMPGGGQLRITTRDDVVGRPPPHAVHVEPGRYAVLTVTDTGTGIAPSVLPRIFEPFFTTKPEGRGTGLGLSTVYGIVQDAGGTVAVTSSGRGTSFTIYLPACAEDRVDAPPAPRPPLREPRCGGTVLLVEDEESVRRVARRMLEAHGFRVLEAGGAAEALRRVQEDDAVDVLLTDVVMPRTSGTELAAAVAAMRPELPLVLMSGCSDPQGSPGAAPYVLQKPFTAEALIATVAEALDRRGAARDTRGASPVRLERGPDGLEPLVEARAVPEGGRARAAARGERVAVGVEGDVPELHRFEEPEVAHERPRPGGLGVGDPVEELEAGHLGRA